MAHVDSGVKLCTFTITVATQPNVDENGVAVPWDKKKGSSYKPPEDMLYDDVSRAISKVCGEGAGSNGQLKMTVKRLFTYEMPGTADHPAGEYE